MRRKPALFDETKKIKIAIVSDPWEIIETRPLGYPRNVYSYPRIVYKTVPVKILPKIRVNLVIWPVKGFQIRVAKKHMLNTFGSSANQMEFEDNTDICISLNYISRGIEIHIIPDL